MHIQFHRTVTDLIAYYQFVGWYSLGKKKQIKRRIIVGLLCLAPFVLFFFSVLNSAEINSILGVVLFGVLLFFAGYSYTEQSILRRYEAEARKATADTVNNELLSLLSITFGADGIQWKGEFSEGFSQYKTIKKTAEDKNYYYLMIASGAAWTIPKNAFQSESDLLAFKKLFAV